MRKSICVAFLAAACAPTGSNPPLPLATAEVEAGAAAGVSGESRFDVTATRDGVSVAADCVAQGTGFRAAFVAPATVAVPSFGAASAAVRVSCAAGGARGARAILPAQRAVGGYGAAYPSIGIGVGTGGGSSGVSIGGYWGNWGGAWGPDYAVRYPDVEIPLQ